MHENTTDLLTKMLPMREEKRIFFGCYSIAYLGLFQRQLRLHVVRMYVGIKRSMMHTYAFGCRLWNKLLLVLGCMF